ncbi:MAG: hypothetical protein ABI807_02175 [Sporichthyaceae bacterium]
MGNDHERLRENLETARPDEDHRSQDRNAGVAIAVLAVVVVGILVAMAMGATDAFRP